MAKDRATGFTSTLSVSLAELGESGINVRTKKFGGVYLKHKFWLI